MSSASDTASSALSLRWVTALTTIVGFGGALGALGVLIDGIAWWFVAMAVLVIVVATTTILTILTVRVWVPVVAAAGAALVTVTFFFASDTALVGLIPTPSAFGRFGNLITDGVLTISGSSIPAPATSGLIFVLAVAIGALGIIAAFVGVVLGRRALVGVCLVAVLAVPGFVSPRLASPVAFAIAAAAWLVLIRLGRPAVERRVAAVVGAAAVVFALVVPTVVAPRNVGSGPISALGITTGVNPIINLGDDLRRPEAITALRYQTTATTGLYLRLTTLERFTGRSWSPAQIQIERENSVDALGAVPGLNATVGVENVRTSVDVGNVLGRWLPAPYPARSVDGLVGEWYWEPDGLTIRSVDSTMRGQEYVVDSLAIRPTAEELRAVGRPPRSIMNRDTAVPDDLPLIVSETAIAVTAGALNDYDRAMALQNYFRGGTFRYSEEAPVENGYDGSGASVLDDFLEARAGYCVHFASAMAVMARILNIPARIAVGFQPGSLERDAQTGATTFVVSSDDLHAWPELYFEGFGWIRFEPTPGRGQTPNYEAALIDDPATPSVDESVPGARPIDDATTPDVLGPDALPGDTGASTGIQESFVSAILAGGIPALIVLAFGPALLRRFRRWQRLAAVRRGSSLAGWSEVLATATDAGLVIRDVDSPRVTARRLPQSDALDRTLAAVEREAFGRDRADATAGDVVGVDAESRSALADIRAVSRSVLAATTWRQRARARALPASLDLRIRDLRIRSRAVPQSPKTS